MKPASVITIEMYLHNESKHFDLRVVDKVEYVVSMDGEEIHRIKTHPTKWARSNDPLRVFELWLINSDESSKKVSENFTCPYRHHLQDAHGVDKCFHSFWKLRLKFLQFKVKFLNIFK